MTTTIPFFAQTQKDLDALLKGKVVEMTLLDLTKPSLQGFTYAPRELHDLLKKIKSPLGGEFSKTHPLFDRGVPFTKRPHIWGFVKDPKVDMSTGLLSAQVKLSETGIKYLHEKTWRITVSLRVDTMVIPVHILEFGNFYIDVDNHSPLTR